MQDEVELIDNKSFTAPGDYCHKFELRISERDKKIIVAKIKSSANFTAKEIMLKNTSSFTDKYFGAPVTQNYETETELITSSFVPHGKNIAPTYHIITITPDKNKLVFEDIDQ